MRVCILNKGLGYGIHQCGTTLMMSAAPLVRECIKAPFMSNVDRKFQCESSFINRSVGQLVGLPIFVSWNVLSPIELDLKAI